jgi:hypothetical protein
LANPNTTHASPFVWPRPDTRLWGFLWQDSLTSVRNPALVSKETENSGRGREHHRSRKTEQMSSLEHFCYFFGNPAFFVIPNRLGSC